MPNAILGETSGDLIPEIHGLQARKTLLICNCEVGQEISKCYIFVREFVRSIGFEHILLTKIKSYTQF